MEDIKNRLINWFFEFSKKCTQHKKLVAIAVISLMVMFGIAMYIAKDSIINIASSQEKFLAALFSDQSPNIIDSSKNASSIAVKPAKECLFDTSKTPAGSPIIINEIAWMGNKESSKNEWIELKNISLQSVQVGDWSLTNQTQKTKIVFKHGATISAGSFYFLERGGADFLQDIKADAFFAGALNNSGEHFRLFDSDCNLVDQAITLSGWPAGDNKTKKTMERDAKTLVWHTSIVSGGTPKKENSAQVKLLPSVAARPMPKAIVLPSTEPSLPKTSSSSNEHLVVSQIMVGSNDNNSNAFVEFYNPTSNNIDLTGWAIKKKISAGSESPLIVSDRLKGKIILPGNYFLTANSKGYTGTAAPDATWPGSYTLAYNNNAVVVYNNLGKKVEEVGWTLIPKNESYQRDSWSSDSVFHLQTVPNPHNSK